MAGAGHVTEMEVSFHVTLGWAGAAGAGPIGTNNELWYNPLAHIIGEMRAGFYGTYQADYVSGPYVFGIGLTLFVITFVMNMVSIRLVRKFREIYE